MGLAAEAKIGDKAVDGCAVAFNEEDVFRLDVVVRHVEGVHVGEPEVDLRAHIRREPAARRGKDSSQGT